MSSAKFNKKNDNKNESEFNTVIVNIRRTAYVTKGGRVFGFSVIVVSGDGKGRIGYGLGKAGEVPQAIQKATLESQRNMIKIRLRNGTLNHEIRASHGASDVIMLPAPAGTGVIAGNAMRAVFQVLGVENIVAKSIGSCNPVNVIRATFNGLQSMRSARSIAEKRGLSIEHVLGEEVNEEA
jgi:small subunit ribosomal protein S5